MTLKNHSVHATIPAADMDRAKAWYSEKLGLTPTRETPGGSVYEVGSGTFFLLYPTPNAGQAPNTSMSFESTDLKSDVAAMGDAGVVFEEYDFPGLKTEGGIANLDGALAAWFKDSEGNILAISQDAV
ncbi:MAG: VOC family protein [Alphaproteobacteria bacterium]|nr:VOC family protein [Alphaproteobacteria bacterium]MBT4710262.1 VOC family protein [Alphaproteobacteria bacterium]MBT5859803.1 VOC family protein [Alphaproteobacteria bacterium]